MRVELAREFLRTVIPGCEMPMSVGKRVMGNERGFSLIELLVVAGVFALMVLMVDAFFASANRAAHTAELAADVAQNGRVAIERLTREARFSSASGFESDCTSLSNPTTATMCLGPDGDWVAFKSARLLSDETVFCLRVVNASDNLYDPNCNATLDGTYDPEWQAWIVYWVDSNGDLRRSVQDDVTIAPVASGGDIIATSVASFDASVSGNVFTVTLGLEATEKVQGSTLPTQRITLNSETFVRD